MTRRVERRSSWIAFDGVAGVATGIPVTTIWTHPIVGGGAPPESAPPLLAVAGSLAWGIGSLASPD